MPRIFGKKKHILGKSKQDQVIPLYVNYYDGCSHGCKYCYGCLLTERFGNCGRYEQWTKPVLVENALKILEKDLQRNNSRGEVFVQSVSDAYMPEAEPAVTRTVLELLEKYEYPIFLLTKNEAVLRDLDFFERYRDNIRVGFTIVTPNEELRQEVEPNSSPIENRIDALKKLSNSGINTVVSLEPLLPGVPIVEVLALVDSIDPYVKSYGLVGKLTSSSIPVEFRDFHLWSEIACNKYDKYYVALFKELLPKLKNYIVAAHTRDFLVKNNIIFSNIKAI